MQSNALCGMPSHGRLFLDLDQPPGIAFHSENRLGLKAQHFGNRCASPRASSKPNFSSCGIGSNRKYSVARHRLPCIGRSKCERAKRTHNRTLEISVMNSWTEFALLLRESSADKQIRGTCRCLGYSSGRHSGGEFRGSCADWQNLTLTWRRGVWAFTTTKDDLLFVFRCSRAFECYFFCIPHIHTHALYTRWNTPAALRVVIRTQPRFERTRRKCVALGLQRNGREERIAVI